MVTFRKTKNDDDLVQILELQQINVKSYLTDQQIESQGFVTVQHTFTLLKSMSSAYKHIVAEESNRIIGYALVMLKEFQNKIEVLKPMFNKLNTLNYDDDFLKNTNYFIMGQICIAKKFRGKGIFKTLYLELKAQMKNDFQYVITEVAAENKRSLKAHYKIGFTNLLVYKDKNQTEWVILIWNWV